MISRCESHASIDILLSLTQNDLFDLTAKPGRCVADVECWFQVWGSLDLQNSPALYCFGTGTNYHRSFISRHLLLQGLVMVEGWDAKQLQLAFHTTGGNLKEVRRNGQGLFGYGNRGSARAHANVPESDADMMAEYAGV